MRRDDFEDVWVGLGILLLVFVPAILFILIVGQFLR